MIAAIIIVGIALAWLGYETQWLTLRLSYRETIAEYDLLGWQIQGEATELPLMPKVRRPGIQAGLL